MSQTVTLRLPEETADWLKDSARRSGRSVNEVGATLFEEARRISEFAEIEFRSFSGERHASVKGQVQVWQVIAVAQGLVMDAERTAGHFGWPTWRAQAALNYYEVFHEEIDRAIAENREMDYDKLRRLFPQLTLIEVAVPPIKDDTERTDD